MSIINWITAPGGLANRLGALGGAINEVNAGRGPQLDARALTIDGKYLASLQDVMSGLWTAKAAYRGTPQQWLTALSQMAERTLLEQVEAEAFYRLVPRTVQRAVEICIQDMLDNGVTVQRPGTLTVAVEGPGHSSPGVNNVGDGVLLASGTGGDGLPLTLMYGETITGVVSGDRSTGSTALAEPVQFRAATGAATKYDWNWPTPAGSGVATVLNFVNAGSAAGSGLLTGGGMESWATSGAGQLPTGTTALVGTPGSTIIRSSQGFGSANALGFVGAGGEFTSVRFPLAGTLRPLTTYAVSVWVSKATAVTAGQAQVALVDGSNVAVDDQTAVANTNRLTLTATAAAAHPNWTHLGGFFRVPKVIPASPAVLLKMGVALGNTETLLFDNLVMMPANQLYAGGPHVALFAGKTEAVRGDYFTVTVANSVNMLTPGNGAMQFLFDRFFGTREMGLLLPSKVSSPTINDNLIA